MKKEEVTVYEDGTVSARCSVHKSTGYLRYWSGGKALYVHREVARKFLGESKLHVNHIDGNKLNNHPTNLEYVTRAENAAHAHRTGLIRAKGEDNGRAKLTAEDAASIRESHEDALTLARRHGISRASVYDIRHGRSWKV